MRARVLLVAVALGLTALLPPPRTRPLPPAAPSRRSRRRPPGPAAPSSPRTPSGLCFAVDPSCDTYALTIVPPASGNYTVEIATTPSAEGDDYDLYVNGPSGQRVGSSTSSGGNEKVVSPILPAEPTP